MERAEGATAETFVYNVFIFSFTTDIFWTFVKLNKLISTTAPPFFAARSQNMKTIAP